LRKPELHFPFVARYELTVLDWIERGADFQRVVGFPDAVPLDPQRELSSGVIVAVRPATGQPWIGLFEHGLFRTGLSSQIIGWPDERSICVVLDGAALLVPTDEPSAAAEIECVPILDLRVLPRVPRRSSHR
jgi:hypothetical protein